MTTVFAQAPADSGLKSLPKSNRNGILEILRMRRDPFAFSEARQAELGKISAMNAFGINIVTCAGAPAAEQILMNKEKAFANGPEIGRAHV